MSYCFTTRSINSLTELKPGDHIRVPRSTDTVPLVKDEPTSHFSSISKQFSSASAASPSSNPITSSGPSSVSSNVIAAGAVSANCSCCMCCFSHQQPIPDIPFEQCDDKNITHHLLVVKAIDDTHIKVIHKGIEGVAEERKRYRQYHVTVLDYESKYTGEEAIKRARDLMSKNEEYKLAHNNCEHFVTEVRTGEKQSKQIQAVVKGAAGGGAGGAVTLGAGGAGAGALIGAGIGSVVPGPGTFVVAVGGAIIGGIAGVVSGGAGGAAGGAALGTRLANT